MPPGANLTAELAAEKQPAPLKVGGVHRNHVRDAVVDRWDRDEEEVRRQLARAEQIADAIASCIAATPELERGITLGGRQERRLEVAERGFRRLAVRDEKILEEFSLYEQLKQARQLPASEYRGERGMFDISAPVS
jgi:hypothetical protein